MKKIQKILCGLLFVLLLCGCAKPDAVNSTTQTTEPEDNTMNILLIGNSSCYYWTDELWGMLDAAGYEDVNVYNLYYSGASLEQHYNWWKGRETACKLYCVNAAGRKCIEDARLEDCLYMVKWDYISFLQASRYYQTTADSAMESISPYLEKLLALVKESSPNAKVFWQEFWAYELGYEQSNYKMDSIEKRNAMVSTIQQVSPKVAETYGLTVVPLSAIWEAVRDNPIITQPGENSPIQKFTLCTRLQSGKLMDDFGHDGDVGGGQYLNACAFYEAITGKDCRENTFRPKYSYMNMDYSLTEEEISLLQNAAHNFGGMKD